MIIEKTWMPITLKVTNICSIERKKYKTKLKIKQENKLKQKCPIANSGSNKEKSQITTKYKSLTNYKRAREFAWRKLQICCKISTLCMQNDWFPREVQNCRHSVHTQRDRHIHWKKSALYLVDGGNWMPAAIFRTLGERRYRRENIIEKHKKKQ